MSDLALVIETTGRRGEVALAREGQIIARRRFPHGLRQAAGVVPLLDELCREQDVTPAELPSIHVSVGPGSFTGTRIGVTVAKTLAWATGAKIVAVPTPRVLAANAPDDATHTLVIIDARRGKLWGELFERQGESWQSINRVGLGTPAELLERAPRPVHVIGEAINFFREPLTTDGVILTDPEQWHARADEVARVGCELERAGQFADVFALEPVYVRRPEAEEKRLGIA